MEVAFFFRPPLRTLECILTKHCQWNNTSVASAALRFSHSGESPLSVRSSLTVPQKSSLCLWSRQDWLLQCYFRRNSRWTNCAHTKDSEQRRTAHLEKIEAWSCHTAFEITPLAPSKIPHSIKARKARFPSLWRHSSAIPVFFSLHISTIALPSFFDRKTAQNSKNKPENLRWMLFWLHCSDCLELAAGRPGSFAEGFFLFSQLSKLT